MDWAVSAHSTSDWVTPLRTSPRTCIQPSLLCSARHCRTTVRITADISCPRHTWCIEGCVIRSSIIVILIVILISLYCFGVFRVGAMASDGLPDGEQAGPSCAPLGPLSGTFLGPALDIQSESLYELAPDISHSRYHWT